MPGNPSYCRRADSIVRRHACSESLKTLTAMWMRPLPNGASQCFGSLGPRSRSAPARAAIPTRNVSGKVWSEAWGTPSATSPL